MKRRLIEFLVLLMVAMGAGPVSSQIWLWSTTADSNATADPHINWAEGMSPSSVNDSGRSMMSIIAAWRNDTSGLLASGGTATAYGLSSYGGTLPDPPPDGSSFTFTAHTTNTGTNPTMSVDGGTARTMKIGKFDDMPSGTILAGAVYRITYNSATSLWLLSGYANIYNLVPLGGLLPYTGTTVPSSFYIFPEGQCLATASYPDYWALLGSPAPGSCAAGQFRILDLRGRTLVAFDNGASRLTAASGCASMSTMFNTCGGETNTIQTSNLPAYTPSGTISVSDGSISVSQNAAQLAGTLNNNGGGGGAFGVVSGAATITASQSGTTATFSGNAQGGSGTGLGVVQPTMAVRYILKVGR